MLRENNANGDDRKDDAKMKRRERGSKLQVLYIWFCTYRVKAQSKVCRLPSEMNMYVGCMYGRMYG